MLLLTRYVEMRLYIYIYMYMLSLQAILNDYNNRSKLYYHDQKLFKFRKSV